MQLPRPQVVLIEAGPRRYSDGAVQTQRIAGGGGNVPYFYLGQHWRAGVVQLPRLNALLGFDAQGWGAGAVPNVGQIEWRPALSADLDAMAALYWAGADITIYLGTEGANPPAALTGKIGAYSVVDGALVLEVADLSADMGRPVLTARFAGTGGIEGPADWAGRRKRRAWGRCWNLEAEPIDKANNVYCLGDPGFPWQAIDQVYDRGSAATSLVTVAWAGSVAATFAALQAAACPAGGGAVAPSIACLKWWIQPSLLTADVRGEIGASYVETVPAMVERIVAARSGPAFTAGTVAAAVTARGAPAGIVVDDLADTVAQVLDRELGAVSLLWLIEPAGTITMRQWAWGASAASLVSRDVQRNRVWPAHRARSLGYRRNRRQMSASEVAAAILADTTVYADGTTAEALKPASIGATNGDNLLPNGLLAADTAGWALAGLGARAAGTNSPPTPNVLAITAASSGGGNILSPRARVGGGRRAWVSLKAMRTGALTSATADFNCYDASTGGGIGPVASLSINPSAVNTWQLFEGVGTIFENGGEMQLWLSWSGNAGRLEIADVKISYTQNGATFGAPTRRSIEQMVTGGVVAAYNVNPVSASTSGSVSTITIAAHTVSDDQGTISYASGSIGGLSPNTNYYIYDDDPRFQGGTRSYVATTNFTALAATGRRYVGFVKTPASSGGTTTGGGSGGGGGNGGNGWPLP